MTSETEGTDRDDAVGQGHLAGGADQVTFRQGQGTGGTGRQRLLLLRLVLNSVIIITVTAIVESAIIIAEIRWKEKGSVNGSCQKTKERRCENFGNGIYSVADEHDVGD